jgi:hypothetical protein
MPDEHSAERAQQNARPPQKSHQRIAEVTQTQDDDGMVTSTILTMECGHTRTIPPGDDDTQLIGGLYRCVMCFPHG